MTHAASTHYTPDVETDPGGVREGTIHMLRKILFATLLMTGLAAAPALAQYGFTVTPGEVTPGSTISITGEGCEPGSEVTIGLSAEGSDDVVTLATTTADDQGDVLLDATIPEDAAPGTYSVSMTCGDHVLSETITVTEASDGEPTTTTTAAPTPTTGGDSGGSSGPLPQTGSNLNGFGLTGAGLLAAGGVLLVATRRRREAL